VQSENEGSLEVYYIYHPEGVKHEADAYALDMFND
jgi:hypothetical protein